MGAFYPSIVWGTVLPGFLKIRVALQVQQVFVSVHLRVLLTFVSYTNQNSLQLLPVEGKYEDVLTNCVMNLIFHEGHEIVFSWSPEKINKTYFPIYIKKNPEYSSAIVIQLH